MDKHLPVPEVQDSNFGEFLQASEPAYVPSAEFVALKEQYHRNAATRDLSDRDLLLVLLAKVEALCKEVAALKPERTTTASLRKDW